VDVGCCLSRGGIVSRKVDELDVEADEVVLRVDTIIVVAHRARETAGRSGAVHDLVRGSHYAVGGGELERSVHAFALAFARVVDIFPASWGCRVEGEVLAGALRVCNFGVVNIRSGCGGGIQSEKPDNADDGAGLHDDRK